MVLDLDLGEGAELRSAAFGVTISSVLGSLFDPDSRFSSIRLTLVTLTIHLATLLGRLVFKTLQLFLLLVVFYALGTGGLIDLQIDRLSSLLILVIKALIISSLGFDRVIEFIVGVVVIL